ncbi:filamentous hemagglutinin N-terminal domain-containing protein [Babesia caballi]|uniref:Filamentous hemagglutinin N-terminal domain-containing protein n=1 Tax=Babesia caballi TaxID=5871 RepID=A0AAV4M5R0_BABCB|nr:filamentous hemagglutinin N-terminal domain-containing protein [Babesia caballi]
MLELEQRGGGGHVDPLVAGDAGQALCVDFPGSLVVADVLEHEAQVGVPDLWSKCANGGGATDLFGLAELLDGPLADLHRVLQAVVLDENVQHLEVHGLGVVEAKRLGEDLLDPVAEEALHVQVRHPERLALGEGAEVDALEAAAHYLARGLEAPVLEVEGHVLHPQGGGVAAGGDALFEDQRAVRRLGQLGLRKPALRLPDFGFFRELGSNRWRATVRTSREWSKAGALARGRLRFFLAAASPSVVGFGGACDAAEAVTCDRMSSPRSHDTGSSVDSTSLGGDALWAALRFTCLSEARRLAALSRETIPSPRCRREGGGAAERVDGRTLAGSGVKR